MDTEMTKNGYEKKLARQLPKMFPNFNQRQFANILPSEKSWFYYFRPLKKRETKYDKIKINITCSRQ